MMRDRSAELARVAVIIPVYGHASLVHEALDSVARCDREGLDLQVVVSIDGDPNIELADVMLASMIGQDHVHTIFSVNGGPGAARNRAIEFALETIDNLDAVYFLDADNRVLPPTIVRLWKCLSVSHAGWAYTDIDAFSVNWTGHYGRTYSALRHCVTDNICDTASLVSAEVFRRGIRFDSARENGFEDWEFWLSCLEAGFEGVRCHDVAFEYRLRAESRFREAQRDRAGSISFLRKRHKALLSRPRLINFEHCEAPRYGLLICDRNRLLLFSDYRAKPLSVELPELVNLFWSSSAEPDNFHFPPHLISCSQSIFDLMASSGLLPTILSHLELLLEDRNVAFVNIVVDKREISIEEIRHEAGYIKPHAADLVAIRRSLIDDVISTDGMDWFSSINAEQVWPTSGVINVHAPFKERVRKVRFVAAEQALAHLVSVIATSPLSRANNQRWTWRSKIVVDYSNLYYQLRAFIKGRPVLPLGSSEKRTAAILTPIASFGGAEKVAYACARSLREHGFETHLFVLGSSRMEILDEFDDSFDFIHIWDRGLPRWGGDSRFIGHDFIGENGPVDFELLRGQLSGFDVVVNNHVMAAHPVMADLKASGTFTACYLHVIDETRSGRPAGQPFAAIAYEHAYNAFITCSEMLAFYLRGFGISSDKLFPVRNGPGFSIDKITHDRIARSRKDRIDSPPRLLYFGRLDVQKGIDRLERVLATLSERGFAFEARVVGGRLLNDGTDEWERQLATYASVLPPAFSTQEIVSHFEWSDILILPSRWEGAPLVIPEAQSVGAIPLCIDVGAISEQIIDGYDGFVIQVGDEHAMVQAMADLIQSISTPGTLSAISQNCIKTSASNSWDDNFKHFRDRLDPL